MRTRYTSRELEEAIDRCIAHCAATGEAPVGFVLHKFLDLPEERLGEYLAEGERILRGKAKYHSGKMERYKAARKWEEFKTFFWLDKAQRDPKNASFAMFNLKQSENGGYGEREARSGRERAVIKLDGVGGEEGMR